MEESDGQMSRVQRELMALRQSGTVKTQADKLKDSASAPLTTPEEAKAFLAAMRDKQKAHDQNKPPAHLTADGLDAWYLQQRHRDREMKQRRQEAENILRGYRMTMSQVKSKPGPHDHPQRSSSMSEKAGTVRKVAESMADPDSEDVYEQQTLGIQRLSIDGGTIAESSMNPSVKQRPMETPNKKVPTPARELLPDELEWRDFVEPDPGARFPAEKGRYHLFASYACPGSHRALIVRALKGLQDVISVTIVHPIWRLTKEATDDEQRGWVFGNPDGAPFSNTAGRGGPFPADFAGSEPEPFYNSYSVRDMYERAGDAAGKYTVPLLWDTVEETIVNNESSDIAYMLNSSFNEFAQNPLLDLYTEEDNEKLNDVIEWLSPLMIHGVYRCGFAKKQESYNRAMAELSAAFDRADSVLQRQRFLTGDTLTDADIRLFVTLFRFDEIYAVYFRANSRLVTLTPSLLNYCRDIYQMEGVADTCSMEHCKAHFYCSHAEWNKFSIIPHGLGFVNLLSQPHMRDELCEVEGEI